MSVLVEIAAIDVADRTVKANAIRRISLDA
jgi:hypothetical protein